MIFQMGYFLYFLLIFYAFSTVYSVVSATANDKNLYIYIYIYIVNHSHLLNPFLHLAQFFLLVNS